ncbi:MAG: hypothetical protein AABO41_02925 [Acidobacteriota bacterium]
MMMTFRQVVRVFAVAAVVACFASQFPVSDSRAQAPPVSDARAQTPQVSGARAQAPPPSERAYQDREILYELQAPESHAFRITHDYTARKPGEQYYFNIVRAGSHVTNPESIDLDSGDGLKWEVISGKQAKDRKLPVEQVSDDSEIVVTYLARPLAPGSTNRIRLKETYTDAKSYFLEGDELVWDRTFGRLRNTVVLPSGWYLTALSSPATIQTLPDGRVSVYIVNPRNDDVRVYLRARRRNVDANKTR